VVFGWDLPRWLVLLATATTIAIVAVMLLGAPRRGWGQIVAIGLIFAGAIGNLYDRLFSCVPLPGTEPIRYHVRDFIDASRLHYPYVFNVADVWLVVGVAYLVLHSLMPGPGRKAAKS
jgi:signal peptidase II